MAVEAVNSSTSGADISASQGWEGSSLDVNILLTIIYLIIFVIGVVGNVCNCLVIADSKNRYMKTATNYYLFSLSISDLLLLIFGLPHDLVNLWHPSPYLFNQFVCISRGWISEASTYASVLVIVTFTIERYLAICHPLKAHTFSRLSRSVKIIVMIWLVASSCALVVVMQYGIINITEKHSDGQESSTSQCTTVQRNEIIFELSVLIFFIIPMAVITILYIKLGYHLRRKSHLIEQNRLKKRQRLSGQPRGSSINCESLGISPRPSCASQSSLMPSIEMPPTRGWLAARFAGLRQASGSANQLAPSSCALDTKIQLKVEDRSKSATQLAAPGEPNDRALSGAADCSASSKGNARLGSVSRQSGLDCTANKVADVIVKQNQRLKTARNIVKLDTNGTTLKLCDKQKPQVDDSRLASPPDDAFKLRIATPVARDPSSCSCQSNVEEASHSLGRDDKWHQQPKLALHSTASSASMQSVIKMLGKCQLSRGLRSPVG